MSDADSDSKYDRSSHETELEEVNEIGNFDSNVNQDELFALELHKDSNRNSLISLEGEIGTEDIVIVHDTQQDHLRKLVDTLKIEIYGHMEEIVKEFQTELNLVSPTSHKKLWLCYEAHFYDAVMGHLVKVYESAYSHISNKLCHCIPQLSADDLNLGDTVVAGLLENTSRKSLQRVQFTECVLAEDNEKATPAVDSPVYLDYGGNDIANGCPSDEGNVALEPAASQGFNSGFVQDMDNVDIIAEKEDSLRTHSSQNSETRTQLDHHVKKVTTHYPSSVTVIYNRRTWPLPTLQSLMGEFERGVDALTLDGNDGMSDDGLEQIAEQQTAILRRSYSGVLKETPSDGLSPARKMRIRAKYRHCFAPALNCIHEALHDSVPLVKLQHLTHCLREIVESVSTLQTEELQMPMGVCCDNLLDMLVVLLCNCNPQTVAQLHAHVMMLTDLMPPCLMNGPYEYSLLQFFGAFQIIQERVVVKSRNQRVGKIVSETIN